MRYYPLWPVIAIASSWPNRRTQSCADVRSPLFAHRVVAELGHFVRIFLYLDWQS
jgi:hypothetical protein